MGSLGRYNMKPNEKYGQLANEEAIQRTVKALRSNNFKVEIVENSEEAKNKVLQLLPQGAEVFTMTSQTLEAIGVDKEINESGKYNATRPKLFAMDRNTQAREMAKIGAAPDWVVASVHAATEDGHLLIASNSGSQLSSEVYAGGRVIFVVGTQKIVTDTQEGIKRIYEYPLPLEDERARKAYGMPSSVNKILIINKEVMPGRITVILVKEKLGF
ncbi:MAG: LUD domain-containing protein [Candidatus Blackburnbacteria bacterium]|nr:LUD domain-containing protein [Candidatus Blackburnbacteria bacterium]